jgi:hypothetical protein
LLPWLIHLSAVELAEVPLHATKLGEKYSASTNTRIEGKFIQNNQYEVDSNN